MAYLRSSLADGLQAVYDEVIRALKGLEHEVKYPLLRFAVDILGKNAQDSTSLKRSPSIEILALVANIPMSARNSDWTKVVPQFLWQLTDRK